MVGTNTVSHICNSSCPVGDGEVSVSPPGIPICCAAAPRALGDVVVEVNIDLVRRTLGSHGIEDLEHRIVSQMDSAS